VREVLSRVSGKAVMLLLLLHEVLEVWATHHVQLAG
jgi:hypothetical protein